MPVAKPMRAVQLVTEGRADEAAVLARALHDQADGIGVESDPEAGAVTQRLTASVLDVVAVMSRRDAGALDRALALVEEAHREGRPAWAAAGYALAARVLVQSGMTGDVITMLASAELDLEDERSGGRKLDPPGGPTGLGAAANNLGAVYHDLGLMDRAEGHLLSAARASSEEYGPTYLAQVAVDLVNLLGFRLAYAIEKETDDDVPGAREQAAEGLALVGPILELAPQIDWPTLVDWTRVLELGCLSLADPASVPSGARHEVRAIVDTSPEGSLLRSPLTHAVLARLSRQAGDAAGAARAAEQAVRYGMGAHAPELLFAWREAALASTPPDSPARSYANALRRSVNERRADLAVALDHRIEMARLERRHAEVRAARELLQRALDEAGEQEARLQEAASHDPLTGLLNRAALHSRLARALSETDQREGALTVAFIDLDGFKQVNDRRGHVVGDQLLAAVAVGLRGAVRDTDVLARYGGDEFVCVREGVREPGDLLHWADRLRQAVEAVAAAVDKGIPVTASIGVCVLSRSGGRTPTEVIGRADAAMYEAKREGPGRVRLVTLA